ncbi:hypothetical protein ACFU99_01010 [Streptomyces sp. NPDC057654]|uniref:hypothetical protein n=1 Tax=Streptomyces sp. NPDC057654 TaxID=3346196 RepID=UPI0036755708
MDRLYDGLILCAAGLGQADTKRLRVDHPVVILGDRIFGGRSRQSRSAATASPETDQHPAHTCRAIATGSRNDTASGYPPSRAPGHSPICPDPPSASGHSLSHRRTVSS